MLPPLRAPDADGLYLLHPSPDEAPRWLARNQKLLQEHTLRIDGVPLVELRQLLRQEIASWTDPPLPALDRPLLVSGHQPELDHPGVWLKHFALHGLARFTHGLPLHLIADNDLPKGNAVWVPWVPPTPGQRTVRLPIPYDRADLSTPYEVRPLYDVDLFVAVVPRLRNVAERWGFEPLLLSIWPETLSAGVRLADVLTRLRRNQERRWGCCNYELSVSRLAQTEAFRRFARHLLADLPRFRHVYNQVLRRLREERTGIQTVRTVAELGPDEAPFWELRGWRRLRATANSPVDALRPRALTLTLFVRLVLADIFLHGLGGAIYDQATDALIADYFGVPPPAYLTATGTLHLPLQPLASPDGLPPPAPSRTLGQLWRDMYWNPQRHLPADADENAEQLARRKLHCSQSEPPRRDHAARVRWFRELRQLTEVLRGYIAGSLQRVEQEYIRARNWEQRRRILSRRDYAWILFPECKLRPFLARFLDWRHIMQNVPPAEPTGTENRR